MGGMGIWKEFNIQERMEFPPNGAAMKRGTSNHRATVGFDQIQVQRDQMPELADQHSSKTEADSVGEKTKMDGDIVRQGLSSTIQISQTLSEIDEMRVTKILIDRYTRIIHRVPALHLLTHQSVTQQPSLPTLANNTQKASC